MKLGSFQFSFCVSIGFHAVVFGTVALTAPLRRAVTVVHATPPLILEMIAAPAGAEPALVAESTPPPQPAAPIEPQPAPVQPVVGETEPVAEPVEAAPVLPVPEPVTAPSLAAVATTTSSTTARGDGSSAQPGPDPTTMDARPGVLARPDYLKNPEPDYPGLARRRGQQGLVLLEVRVNVSGRAAEVSLKQPSGHPLLDEAAMKAVREWDFEPARIGTRAVESRIEVPVRFKLSR